LETDPSIAARIASQDAPHEDNPMNLDVYLTGTASWTSRARAHPAPPGLQDSFVM